MTETPTHGLNLARTDTADESGFIFTEAHSTWSKGWLARIQLAQWENTQFDLERSFITPTSADLSRVGNGHKSYALSGLDDGIYEADSVWRSFKAHRVYFEVRDHAIVRRFANKEEAKAALKECEVPAALPPVPVEDPSETTLILPRPVRDYLITLLEKEIPGLTATIQTGVLQGDARRAVEYKLGCAVLRALLPAKQTT